MTQSRTAIWNHAAGNNLNRVLLGEDSPHEQHDDGAYNGPDEASAFAGPVKAPRPGRESSRQKPRRCPKLSSI